MMTTAVPFFWLFMLFPLSLNSLARCCLSLCDLSVSNVRIFNFFNMVFLDVFNGGDYQEFFCNDDIVIRLF